MGSGSQACIRQRARCAAAVDNGGNRAGSGAAPHAPHPTRSLSHGDTGPGSGSHRVCTRPSGSRISDSPAGAYDAKFFVGHVEGFLDALDLNGVTLAGVSIGANIALIIAARRNRRVVRIIPINPYDYDRGKGMAWASLPMRVVIRLTDGPVVGEIVITADNRVPRRAALTPPSALPARIQ